MVVLVVIVAITAFGIIKLRLLQPVLLHHYNPRGKRSSKTEDGQELPSDERDRK